MLLPNHPLTPSKVVNMENSGTPVYDDAATLVSVGRSLSGQTRNDEPDYVPMQELSSTYHSVHTVRLPSPAIYQRPPTRTEWKEEERQTTTPERNYRTDDKAPSSFSKFITFDWEGDSLGGSRRDSRRRSYNNSNRVSVDHFDPSGVEEISRRLSVQSSKGNSRIVDKVPAAFKDSLGDDRVSDSPDVKSFDFETVIKDVLERGQAEHIPIRSVGVLFKDLKVTVHAPSSAIRPTIGSFVNPSYLLQVLRDIRHPKTRDILSGFDGVVSPGEMLLVLGRPGSGCSTLLKTLANQTEEYFLVSGERHYDSLSPQDISNRFRGDVAYCPEDDVHFPTLTVQDTVSFAAKTRMPNIRLQGQTRKQYAADLTELLLTVFGLRHTKGTKVGDAELRGVSGGEKKRVSISEALAARCLLGCWDNSTRGLDSSTALEFGRALRIATDLAQMTTIVSIYQAGENLYELFDKVCVIGEGRMFYYGRADKAREYFKGLGYLPANRQTTADFLVSVTDPSARIPNSMHQAPLPRTSEEFARAFKVSREGKENNEDMMAYWHEFVGRGDLSKLYAASAKAEQSKWASEHSPYTTSLLRQLKVVSLRRWQMFRGSLMGYIIQAIAAIIQSIVVGTVFLKTPNNTSSFFSRGGVMYFAIAFGSIDAMSEIPSLYSQRPILHRHKKAAMYHPFMDALAFTIVDILPTLVLRILFGTILYFLVGLQHTAKQFFTFYLVLVLITLCMKALYRAIAASTRQLSAAQAVAGFVTTTLVTYAGYTIPKPSIPGAAKWVTDINPLALAFESILVNEIHSLDPPCSSLVPQGPGYENVSLVNQVCTTVGSVSGQINVNGNLFLEAQYSYSEAHLWRNVGVLVALWGAFLAVYLFFTEINTTSSTDFSRVLFKVGGQSPQRGRSSQASQEENSYAQDVNTTYGKRIRMPTRAITASRSQPPARVKGDVFSWRNVTYSVSTNEGQRVLLDNVAGYVAPGKLTALMGESGAGKTTLLNVLAGRQGVGVVGGEILVNGKTLPVDFKSQTAYCQQTDTHTDEQTVREALLFSAKLRQPAFVPLSEKEAYVETCLMTCGLEAYADAIVGTLGVEHKKRTTIGVELAAKPRLLLFLDEPTSGLDSQSSLAIMKFLRSLADGGQAILCTIHQPSGELFQYFDRLLLLRKGGKTVYFGDLGRNCKIMTAYFEGKGARPCGDTENPAEWMLEVIGTGSTSLVTQDWHDTWLKAYEAAQLEDHLVQLHSGHMNEGTAGATTDSVKRTAFATSWSYQFMELLKRTFLSYWRNPVYVMSVVAVNFFCGLLVGLSFKNTPNTIQGTENKLFAVFMTVMVGIPVGNQLQVMFVNLRRVFEVRERASQMYHWSALLTSQFIVDYLCNVLGGLVEFNSWFWLVGFSTDRAPYSLLMLAFIYPFYFTSLAQMCAAMSSTAQAANRLYALLFSFVMVFSGVLQPFRALGWWKWMNRISSIGYIIEGILGQAIGNQLVECADKEFSIVQPASGLSCEGYMNEYIRNFGGYLSNPTATSSCEYCSIRTTDQYIADNFNMFYSHRWRDVGIVLGVSIFNLVMMYSLAYFFRIRQGSLFSRRKGLK